MCTSFFSFPKTLLTDVSFNRTLHNINVHASTAPTTCLAFDLWPTTVGTKVRIEVDTAVSSVVDFFTSHCGRDDGRQPQNRSSACWSPVRADTHAP